MRVPVLILAALMLSGCGGSPTAPDYLAPPVPFPTPAAPGPASLAVLVIDAGGACLVGAVVEIVQGQRAGTRIDQDPGCDAWSFPTVYLNDLIPGEQMVVRASAPGYRSHEQAAVPVRGRETLVSFLLTPDTGTD
jgi:hypothetical protein